MKSQAMVNQIKELESQGVSIRRISESLGISRNTVRRYLRGEDCKKSATERPTLDWMEQLNWELILKEVNSGVTKKQLYKEHLPPVSYKRFCKVIASKNMKPQKPAPRLAHEPGEKVYIDYCDGLKLTCPITGKKTKTHFFCGVLPFSSYTFGCFTENQKLPNFIRCHEKMWAYFGGVTPYAVIDNLKSGVKKAHLYDPEKNPTYCDYGNHTGFAVLPTRPYTPRDKASVETAVGVVQRTFYQEVRNETFYSLAELNVRFYEFLENFNHQIMKDYGVSRWDRFQNEKNLLQSISGDPYEFVEWKTSKVHPDCCIQVDKSFYSVPYKYCGQSVKVKLTDKLVEIYNAETEKIAFHLRAKKHHSTLIEPSHLPPWAIQNSKFEVIKCKKIAEAIGPNTEALVNEWFSGSRPLAYLRRAQGLCRLHKDGCSREAVEYASAQAITFHKHQLSFITSCAKAYVARPRPVAKAPERDPNTIHLHGGI